MGLTGGAGAFAGAYLAQYLSQHFGCAPEAAPATGAHAELRGQLLYRAQAGARPVPDLSLGYGIADADVHFVGSN